MPSSALFNFLQSAHCRIIPELTIVRRPVLPRILQESGCLTISGEFSGLPPGKHGLHVHCFGDISNDWISAGPHYNPYNKTNGAQQENRYAGVLGIVNANEDGLAKMDLQVSHLHLTGINSIIGRTLVIHQSEDEPGKSDKEDSTIAGSEGNGVAWGVIGICQSNISEEYLEEKN
ncbi:superoxide dismutase [Cu-Zn]-like isoform X2 [Leucoraja erinacea]|uniref:superoxide dismutase [Cu-Zn]-like isoform X2 n=1 Tax=Leucoraja erinaceus TaxID=7782 RepID=UPI00245530E9|nr:superoxide dismutase [Cu-Zn]-like isoform X2 [Leucoraja erinacea]